MLTIRLKRTGRKHQPSFRVIVTPKGLGGPQGKPVEYLGWYNSLLKKFELKKERIQYWLSQGAQPSASLHNLLVKAGVSNANKIPVHKKSKRPAEAAPQATSPEAGQSGSVEATKPEAEPTQAAATAPVETEAQPTTESADEAQEEKAA